MKTFTPPLASALFATLTLSLAPHSGIVSTTIAVTARFEDVTAKAGLEGAGFCIGVAVADLDNVRKEQRKRDL